MFRSLDLPLVLPQLRRYVCKSEGLEYLLLTLTLKRFLSLKEAVFIQLEAEFLCTAPHRCIVFGAACKVMEGKGILAVRDYPEISVNTAVKNNTRLGITLSNNGLDIGKGGKEIHDSTNPIMSGAGHDIYIFDNLFSTPDTPGDTSHLNILILFQ